MELIPVSKDIPILNKIPVVKRVNNNSSSLIQVSNEPLQFQQNPFIEANTKSTTLDFLKQECISPVYASNELAIAHDKFIEVTQECITEIYPNEKIDLPDIRCSHLIKGRKTSAIHKKNSELTEEDITRFYERLAFVIRIPSIKSNVNGNLLSLTIGGVRCFNKQNLFRKKSMESFQVFCGFTNTVCTNLTISTDGYQSCIKVSSISELKTQIKELIQKYNIDYQIKQFTDFSRQYLSEKQFAQLVGRAKLYQFLPKKEKLEIPQLLINDGQISTIAKDYYQDERFCKNEVGNINLWDLMNLFTSANKSSYIDTFLDRNVNAFDFTKSISKAVNDGSYHWFLS
ncbi:DUF3871 family protein [Tenacibaculum maritimum]|nr:DUF3871 family protein [Tenacibaculum maritimum]MDB0611656.1 DUF3871 family protein [Tenacibaculum maritimum]